MSQFNKYFGAAVGALLIFLLASLATRSLFTLETPRQPGYVIEVASPEAPVDEGGEAPAAAGGGGDLSAVFAAATAADGEKVFKKCSACHKVAEGQNAVGPSLWGVVGRPVGAIDGFAYSGALGRRRYSAVRHVRPQ
jgi:cytochrome c